jgi:chaperonin GroES
MNFKPMRDNVLVAPEEAKTTTDFGIVLPEKSVDAPTQGVIVAVGPGKSNDAGVKEPLMVNIGEIVLFHKQAGTEVDVDGEKFLLINQNDLIGVIA